VERFYDKEVNLDHRFGVDAEEGAGTRIHFSVYWKMTSLSTKSTSQLTAYLPRLAADAFTM
jgi:hypothetical protein